VIRSAAHSSYPRIGDGAWDQQLLAVARERAVGRAADADVRAVEDEVAALVVAEQSRAFLDVVTDGLVRWSGPVSHAAARMSGVSLDGIVRWFETACTTGGRGSTVPSQGGSRSPSGTRPWRSRCVRRR